jgi:hypothetical protein
MTNRTETHNPGSLGRTRLQFEIYKGKISDGYFEKQRLAGLGFLRDGKHEYKLKIFSRLYDRFYVRPIDSQKGLFKVFVRDEIQTKGGLRRVYWCEAGDGIVHASLGLMEIRIDLTSEALYMSIFPRKFDTQPTVPDFNKLRVVA